MTYRFKHWLAAAVSALLAAAAAGGCAPDHGELLARIDASLARAGKLMMAAQAPDGAWRSDTYGALKAGPALTPHVMSSLFFIPQAGPDGRKAFDRGVEYLVGFVGDDGRARLAPRELMFPIFAAASASRVVALADKSPRNLAAQQAWLAYLRDRQLNESLGWRPDDRQYGGWGFSLAPPRKPPPGEPLDRFYESNMVATVWALAALRSAKVPPDDPSYGQILVFARKCQNFAAARDRADGDYDDGGFFFIPGDPVQNKAGIAGTDRHGRRRFRSYGTMTADGLRILLRCGLPPSHPRVVAARRWLARNFSATANPGTFAPDREVLRNATYYYWAWAVAHTWIALRSSEMNTPAGRIDGAVALAEELLRRQRPDGSWVNRYTDAKEDDPLVSTPYSAAALAICRGFLSGQLRRHPKGCATLANPAR